MKTIKDNLTKSPKITRASVKKYCPALFESEAKRKARSKAIKEMFRSPLFTEDIEEQRETGALLMKALADARKRGERR
jgi:hypothetical protein